MKKLIAASVLVTTPLLAACGNDGPSATPSDSIEVTAEDFKFGPAEWHVNAGTFTLTFHNESAAMEHEWAILNQGVSISTDEEFEEDLVLTELEKQPPGTTISESFTIDEPGEYQVICALEGHLSAGMIGKLVVHEAA